MQESTVKWWQYPAWLLQKIESERPFTEGEAWFLFRFAALAEAVGWTALIGGILIRHFNLIGSGVAVPIAGRVHGMIFITYFFVLAAVYSSLRWPRTKFLVAILAGVPPYGTLLFEQWAAHQRRSRFSRQHYLCTLLTALATEE